MDRGYAHFLERRLGEVRGITLPRTPVNKAVENVDNRAREAYTAGLRYDAKKTPSPRMAPGGGGPTKDLLGPRGESPARLPWLA